MRSRRGALLIGASAALFLGLGPRGARAESPHSALAALPIALELDGCQALDQAELYELLAIEFHTLNVLPATPPEHVHVQCASERAVVTLDAVNGSNNGSSEVELGATAPAVWPRLLALSVSEIIIESRARAAAHAMPSAAPRPAATRSPQSTPIQHGNSAFRSFAGITLRRAIRPATWLWGPDLGASLELSRTFSLAADLRLELGRTDTALAKIDWLSASGALALLVGGRVGDWGFGLGPGVCVGYLRLSPQTQVAATTGHTVSGPWAGLELVARARYDFDARWFLLGGVDSGMATTSVTGLVNGEQPLLDTGGAWLSATLGAGTLL